MNSSIVTSSGSSSGSSRVRSFVLRERSGWASAVGAGLAYALLALLTLPAGDLLGGVLGGWWGLVFVAGTPLLWIARVWGGPWKRLLVGVTLGSLPLWLVQQWWTWPVTMLGTAPFVLVMTLWAGVQVGVLRWAGVVLGEARWRGWAGLVTSALLWAGVEQFRGEVFLGGYSWGQLGSPLIDSPLSRWAGVVGLAGVSLLAALVNAALVWGVMDACDGPGRGGLGRLAQRVVGAGIVVALGMSVDPGTVPLREGRGFSAAVIQTNIGVLQKQDDSAAADLRDFVRMQELTVRSVLPDPDAEPPPAPSVVVWPETMAPGPTLEADAIAALRAKNVYFPLKQPVTINGQVFQRVQADAFYDQTLRLQGFIAVPMLVGEEALVGYDMKPTGEPAPGGGNEVMLAPAYDARFNSAYLIDDERVTQRYDKIRLTPFGEFIPVIHRLGTIQKAFGALGAAGLRMDLSAGTERTVFAIALDPDARARGEQDPPTARVVAPICFEVTWAGHMARYVVGRDGSGKRTRVADVFVNLTNDAWFGSHRMGREQHLQACRWRSAELGTPMVRAANTGISAFIDHRGRVISRGVDGKPGDVNVEGSLRGEVALPEAGALTAYARAGAVAGWAGLGVLAGVTGAFGVRRWRSRAGRGRATTKA